MTWEEKIKNAHLSVTSAVSHYEKMQSDRYFVWQEDSSEAVSAEGRHTAGKVMGTTDFFTKTEQDPWKEDLERAFGRWGISWSLNSVQYEEDTGFIHYEWVWEVDDGTHDF